MKLAVIGAGSTYTPELVSGLMRERERIDVRELVLHDIDADRREVVGGLARRILARQGFAGSLELTGELDRALDGADAVLIQIRVGGQAARLRDETIPAACGCVGQETTGAGGLAKAMRTVPVVLEIAQRARELAADDAWIVDFTNPVGIVTRALLDAGHRAVGLCNVAITFQRRIAAQLGVAAGAGAGRPGRSQPSHLDPRVLARRARRARRGARRARRRDRRRDRAPAGAARRPRGDPVVLPALLLRRARGRRTSSRPSTPRAQTVAEIERELLELYRDPGLTEKPALLEQRGGAFYSEAATQLVASLATDSGDVQVVDVRNDGTLAGLADDDVVEVPARIRADGAAAAAAAAARAGAARPRPARRRVRAAGRVGRDHAAIATTARLALLCNPLVREYELADGLLDELLGRHAAGARR